MPAILLGQLAAQLGCELAGDPDIVIGGVSTLDKAEAGQLSFLANLKYSPKVKQSRASAILATKRLIDTEAATLISSNPYYDFARALALFYQAPEVPKGIHPTAVIAATAHIGDNAAIGAYAVIGGNVTIGANATIYPHAVIYEGCIIGDDFTAHSHVSVREHTQIGDRVTLHNGVVVGGDGFGFARNADGRQFKIVQTGRAVLEDDVEVQTLSSIDKATVGETRVKRGAKIDSLVQVGHACVVGEDNIICAQAGLAGSTVLEASVTMAGQSGSAGHLTIRKGATVYAQAGVGHDVPENTVVGGSPAFEAREWRRASTAFARLPDLLKTVRQLEQRVDELEQKLVR
ncbi:MAG: UDP-3-O-(3-hydroxymyristoyl)glucosamine N-acyltransferase [Bryobacteraceae bacterium]